MYLDKALLLFWIPIVIFINLSKFLRLEDNFPHERVCVLNNQSMCRTGCNTISLYYYYMYSCFIKQAYRTCTSC